MILSASERKVVLCEGLSILQQQNIMKESVTWSVKLM